MKLLLLFVVIGAVLIMDYFGTPATEPVDEAVSPSWRAHTYPTAAYLPGDGYAACHEEAMAEFKAAWSALCLSAVVRKRTNCCGAANVRFVPLTSFAAPQ